MLNLLHTNRVNCVRPYLLDFTRERREVKVDRELACLRLIGKLFQILGAAVLKALAPAIFKLYLGTMSWLA